MLLNDIPTMAGKEGTGTKFASATERMAHLEDENKILRRWLDQAETDTKCMKKMIASYCTKILTLESSFLKWNQEQQKQSSKLERLTEQLERLKDNVCERKPHLKMNDTDLRLKLLETASYDGTLLWKISGYCKRKSDAKYRKTISLYSQPFYTSRHGYKLCARVYLNGDGIGEGSHLSLFFVVMKGDHDALLEWPFQCKVTLRLLDQVNTPPRHLQDIFRPNTESSSFQKPMEVMNVASGCPLFVGQSVLEATGTPYIRDDTIYIQVIVDTEGRKPHSRMCP